MNVIASQDTHEAADRVLERDDFAVLTGEHLSDVERLRQEALDLARAEYGQLVFLGKLVHAEDRDDVLQLLVTLQHRLHAARGVVVLLAHDQRIKLPTGGIERVNRWVDAERRD